jgi:putative transposase
MHFRSRQQRPRGYNDPGHGHELTFSCRRRLPFLSKERTCRWLADAIRDAKAKLNYDLWAYVFMPEHVHLVVYPREKEYNDSDFLKLVKEPVGRKGVQFLRRYAPEWLPRIRQRRGDKIEYHFWQSGRGFDRNIEQSWTLQAMIDYVHMNPVRRGLVEYARDWKWSSAGWYEGAPLNDLKPDPIPWDWLEEAQ